MSITSDEVNYLVFRYLQESGFQHSAFTFGYESVIHKNDINGNDVPPGALISFIQKGLQYLELEANLVSEGSADETTTSDFTLLQPEELLTKEVDELRETIRKKREQKNAAEKQKQDIKKPKHERRRQQKGMMPNPRKLAEEWSNRADDAGNGAGPMEEDTTPDKSSDDFEVYRDDVTVLTGHQTEVFTCAWNPKRWLLASGSGDATARIWKVGKEPCGKMSLTEQVLSSREACVLKHTTKPINTPKQTSSPTGDAQDVTTLQWSPDGKLLGTGSYDGVSRIWDCLGNLQQTLIGHKGPLFSLKWNKTGDRILSGSVDRTAIVWDPTTGEMQQQFGYHKSPVLDVDWQNDDTFATCSTDKLIYVCRMGSEQPVATFSEHKDEVNAIQWDPSGTLLASCADDNTAKIWKIDQEKSVFDLKLHNREIYTIKWSPTGKGSANPNLPLLLASASFDATVRIWEVEKGTCLHELCKHTDPIYTVAFSPCGTYIATGSFDRTLYVWNVQDGKCLKHYESPSGIFEVCWNKEGNRIAACHSNANVSIIDFDPRM